MTNLPSEMSQMYNEEYYRNWNAPALKVEAIRLHKELAIVMQENKDALTRIEKEARENLIKEFGESFGAYIKPEDGPVKLLEDSYIMPVKYVDHLISSLTKERKDIK